MSAITFNFRSEIKRSSLRGLNETVIFKWKKLQVFVSVSVKIPVLWDKNGWC